MNKIVFVQPAVPKYRVPFFNKIKDKVNIHVFTASKDFLNVKTIYSDVDVSITGDFLSLFKNKLFWMKGLPLYKAYNLDDIVVINGNPRIINYMILFCVLKLRGIKTVWWGHGWSAGSYGLSSKFRLLIMKLLSDYQLFYTDLEKKSINGKYNYALNNGLESEVYEILIKNSGLTRNLPSMNARLDLVFIGRITEKSNFKLLLQALSTVKNKIHLNVIGTSDDIDKYKLYAEDLNISQNIHWYGEVFDDLEITKIMLNSHAFIYAGSVGLSLIHAFNYGLPAIIHSSSKHHMPEYAAFSEGVNGFSFKENDAESLSAVIDNMATIPDAEYEKLSINSYQTVKKTFNISDMSERFLKMIEVIRCQ
ncbi:glycosyltransferase family 4 protein [Photobacterium phosphoreum]|uniref:glycosyltransferase family 4 protein n=1 Tax=Photobacterium phosphoreum TaxID=659 RepID=UPI0015E653CD|nr:glycosyltransferase family 4 protein [Photobacterium phosphoreum]